MDDKSAPSATLGAEDNDNDSSNNGNSSSSSDDDVVSLKSKDSMVSGIIINHDDEEEDYEGAGAPPPKAKKAKAKDKAPKKAPKAAAQPKAKKAKPANNQSKGTFWFGTWNNPPGPASNTKPEDLRWPEPLPQEVSGVHYSVERGENGTVHFQFVIKMARQTRFAAVHKLYPECYLEVVTPEKGGVDGALKYCEKEDTHIAGPFTVGEPVTKRQGKRTDLDEVKKAIKEGFSDGQLYDHFFNSMARYPHLAHHARMAWASKALRDVEVNVYYGVAGGGKSHAAYHDMPDAYRKPDAGQWWDGYQVSIRITQPNMHNIYEE